MSRLGITSANEAQHEWRRALAMGQFPPDKKVEVRRKIAVYLRRLNISKPHMLVWFIMSKGEQYLEDLIRKDQREIERILQETIKKLNYEFGVRCPIH